MADTTCSVDDCKMQAKSRGWCIKHYKRWVRHGDPTFTLRPGCDPWTVDRLAALHFTVDVDGCWIWHSSIDSAGYGRLGAALAHRVMYELVLGPIPDGLTLDHLCRVRACVNPDHLEPVTLAENKFRGDSPAEINRRKAVCIRGHDIADPANIYVCKRGKRSCRICRAIRRSEGRR